MDCSDWQIIPAENLVAAFQVFHSLFQVVQLQQDLLERKQQGSPVLCLNANLVKTASSCMWL